MHPGAWRRTRETNSSHALNEVGCQVGGRIRSSQRGCPRNSRSSVATSWRVPESAAARARDQSGDAWAALEPTLPRRISERMMKRVIAVLRDARHGGTIVFVPVEDAEGLPADEPYIDVKYKFENAQPHRSFPDLVVDILNRLAQIHGRGTP